ncbi:hypothetical protein X772_14985 [Mesorhizobium sp. LSJC280B00]|nr:hypothetical protein X772_14985 [Mesorhizobium sp. LSJC280B00]
MGCVIDATGREFKMAVAISGRGNSCRLRPGARAAAARIYHWPRDAASARRATATLAVTGKISEKC